MAVRDYNFTTGPQTPVLPTASTPSGSTDVVTKGYADTQYGISVSGSRASPNNILAIVGITPPAAMDSIMFVQGSGGAVDITVNPQIASGTTVGQRLTLIGRSNTNYLQLDDGTGLSLNGSMILEADDTITLVWDGTNWLEITRKDAT